MISALSIRIACGCFEHIIFKKESPAMQDAFKRLQILMGDTLQIADHMKVAPEYEQMYQQIVNGLKEQNEKIETSAHHIDVFSISKHLSAIKNMVQQLEGNFIEDYKKSTGNQIGQYEQMSLEEQMEQTENYHHKMDYLSAAKMRENLIRMNEVLQALSGKRESGK
jgi:hypothetical protein